MASFGDACDEPRCRLCWGDESEGQGKLISPCNCRGSMGYIHIDCLKHWLDTTRQQGRSRRASNKCEICHSKYRTGIHSLDHDSEQLQLLPSPMRDPFTIASLIHGSYRLYVGISGLLKAFAIYRSIELFRSCTAPPAVSPNSGVGGFGMSSNTSSWRTRSPRWPQPRRQHQDVHVGRLSVSMPLGGAHVQHPAGQEVLSEVRDRFDKATMVQVYWYTSLMAATPQPPNADAFTGMALGATIGGIMAQLIFLPLLGSSKISALRCSGNLLLRCLVRLLAAEACGARGYRLVAAAVRTVMERHRQWGRQFRQRLLRAVGRGRGVAMAADGPREAGGEGQQETEQQLRQRRAQAVQ